MAARTRSAPLDPRRELLALHRELYRRQQKLIDASVAAYPPDLDSYARSYRRRVSRFERVASHRELLEALDRCDVAYVGDYHTLKVAQRAFYKLAFHAAESGRPLVLALELFDGRYQRAIDAYLRGAIGEAELLRAVHYAEHQVFDVWPNFQPIVELAKRLAIPVLGIDHAGFRTDALRRRDAYAASKVLAALRRPDRPRVLVLAGQLHVAPPHLPAQVSALARAEQVPEPRSLVVYQNCESIYWQLADAGLEQRVEVVRLRPDAYCLINTSPIVCQRSYLDWLEGDVEAGTVEPGSPELRFRAMAALVAAFLGLEAEEALADVEVYAAGDLSFLDALRRRGAFGARELALIRKQVLTRESYYLPRANVVYLANLSVNHAAEEATRVVRHFCAGEALLETRSLVDSFYFRCIDDALAFFGSKVVNDRRKCAHDKVWQQRLRSPHAPTRRIAEQVAAHRAFERGARARVSRLYQESSTETFHAVTRALGTMLGDRLYYALVAGQIAKHELRELFLDPLDEEGAAMELYLHLSRKLERTRLPQVH